MTDELKPCPLTWAIQRLNSTPYSLTKDECVDVLRGLRDEIRALAAAQPAQAGEVDERVAFERWATNDGAWPDNIARSVESPDEYAINEIQQAWLAVQAANPRWRQRADELLSIAWPQDSQMPRASLPTQPAAQADSMGMPTSCGKPLCLPDEHHPLCKLHKPAAQDTPEPVGEARCSTCGVTMNELHHPACGAVTAAIIGLNTMAAQDKEARRRELAEKIRETLRGVFTHPAPGVPEIVMAGDKVFAGIFENEVREIEFGAVVRFETFSALSGWMKAAQIAAAQAKEDAHD